MRAAQDLERGARTVSLVARDGRKQRRFSSSLARAHHLPGGHEQRVVPRRDEADGAQRLLDDLAGEAAVGQRNRLRGVGLQLVGQVCGGWSRDGEKRSKLIMRA